MVENIIIVNDFGHINGGAGKVAYMEAFALSQKGYNVIWFCATTPDMSLFEKYNIKVICTNQYDIVSNPSRIKAIIQGCWNSKAFDEMCRLLSSLDMTKTIVHVHCFSKALSASIFESAAKYKAKVCYTLHDYFSFCPNGGLYNYKSKTICHLKPGGLSCAVCNCDSRSYAQKMFRNVRHLFVKKALNAIRNRMAIVSIGLTNERVSKPSLYRYSNEWYYLKNPIELNEQEVVDISKNDTYLFIARLSSEKGIELFCEAISQLGLKGCVLGDGYLMDEYKTKYPSIEFAGWVCGAQKESYIRKGKCLVFPSLWYEGAPLTTVEMKSYGFPCIVPDECAASEDVEDGKTGYIFKIGSLESLKQALCKFEKTDMQVMQQNVINSFNPQIFTSEYHVNNLIKIYEKVLRGKGK